MSSEPKRFEQPDDRLEFPHGHAEVLTLGGAKVQRVTYEPGFRWTNDLAGAMGTDRCQLRHRLYVLSGRLALRLEDGSEQEVGPGGVALVEPGHDSWTVGDEPVVFLDFDPGS